MSRKSRKNEIDYIIPERVYSTAIYARLSVENEEDSSMAAQIELIRDYIDSHSELVYTDTYTDNGYTGTNFERPAFMKLIRDIRKRKINCVVVKDMSRFGRNYIEAGYYIETVFPFLKARLISINDNFDSNRRADMESLVLPIKNMINMMYAKDISKKVWTALQQKKKNGYSAGNTIPYGYKRNPATQRNEIDTEKAFYVHMIFQWKLRGVSVNEIRKRLDMINAPTPGKRREKSNTGWNNSTISMLLRNRVYIGDTVSNKTAKALYCGRDKTVLGKESWIITENTHDAIIAKDDFEKVQEILKEQEMKYHAGRKKTKDMQTGIQNDIRGLVFCKECGFPMYYKGKGENGNYICRNKNRRINAKLLEILLLKQINILSEELSEKDRQLKNILSVINNTVTALIKESRCFREKRRRLYERHAAGICGMREYECEKSIYLAESERIRCRLEYERDRLLAVSQKREILKNYFNDFEMLNKGMETGEFVRKYIKRIEAVSGKEVNLVFRYCDILEAHNTEDKEERVV